MKIVINRCYGGFGLSTEAIVLYYSLKNIPVYFYAQTKMKHRDGYDEWEKIDYNSVEKELFTFMTSVDYGKSFRTLSKNMRILSPYEIERTDPDLIKVIETLGDKADGPYADLQIYEIPDGMHYYIDDYDGIESVHEEHRSWP